MQNAIKYFLIAIVLIAVLVPNLSYAHTPSIPYWGAPLLSCNAVDAVNPEHERRCESFCDILHTVQHIIYFLLTIAIVVITPIMASAGGLLLIFSGGSKKLYDLGKNAMVGAAATVVFSLVAFVAVATFLWILGNGTGDIRVSWPNIPCSADALPDTGLPGSGTEFMPPGP